jgi:hypothetical protein
MLRLLVLLQVLWVPLARDAGAETAIAVVAGKGVEAAVVDKSTLANIYRRKTLVDEHGHVYVPANLPVMHPLRRAFSLALFDQTPEDMEAYWNEQYFHGISPPFVVASIEAMIRFVATTSGAIGYIPECRIDDRTRVLMTLPSRRGEDLRGLCDETTAGGAD